MESGDTKTICKVCTKQFAKYTCPRCNLRYCSLPCYKAHSTRCTEVFYSELVAEELQGDKVSDAQKQQMQAILERVQQQQEEDLADQDMFSDHNLQAASDASDDEQDGGLSKETLAKLLDREQAGEQAEVNEADLSEADLQAFRRALATGEVSRLVPAWEPWWMSQAAAELRLSSRGMPVVALEQGEQGRSADEARQIPPAPHDPLPSLKTLTRAAPSPMLQPQLLELLFAYCLTLRLYNGDFTADPLEAAAVVLHLKPTAQVHMRTERGSQNGAADQSRAC
ncbi:hypothetical protein WJX72_001783 [[Myrmecia] bisecta]|uniref:HIT-type domain-containing protein n=1 Tax=[Myrmecia] bisecta TaxID=41462 RepID=A0AAW1PA57_9CHLO